MNDEPPFETFLTLSGGDGAVRRIGEHHHSADPKAGDGAQEPGAPPLLNVAAGKQRHHRCCEEIHGHVLDDKL